MSTQNLARLLRARRALIAGSADTTLTRAVHARIVASAAAVLDWDVETAESAPAAPLDDVLLIVFDKTRLDAPLIARLAARGCAGVAWVGDGPIPPPVLAAARPSGLRFIGSRSAGLWSASGLHAGAFEASSAAGYGLALITQSGSIAAAAADWAAGRDIDLAWTVTTGAEADADIADWLDVAAADAKVRAVAVQLGRIGPGRKFMSAARACARLKPVVVLQNGIGAAAGSARDVVRSAAFARAGLVECGTLDGLFDALSAITKLPDRRDARVLTIGSGNGMCALGVEAVRRRGLTAANAAPEAVESLRRWAPRLRVLDGGIDVGGLQATDLPALCRQLLDDPAIDDLLLVFSPFAADSHEHYVQALASAELGPRLVTVWLGLKSVAAARRHATTAGLSTFATADQAARALRYRWLYRRTRELLMQTPPARVLHGGQAGTTRRQAGSPDEAAALPDAYGLPAAGVADGTLRFELGLQRHHELGCYLQLGAVAGALRSIKAYALPPLDGLLAARTIEVMRLEMPPALSTALGDALLRLSQLALEQPRIARLELQLGETADGGLVRTGMAPIVLDDTPLPDAQRLALAPYPDHLQRVVALRGGVRYRIRAVLPEDEPAVVGMLEQLRPDDVRLRFFVPVRQFSHEMGARMTQIDYDREMAWVAEPEATPGVACAITHLTFEPYGGGAEFAVVVHHEHAGTGLGTTMMRELLDHARRSGATHVFGQVLPDNLRMLTFAATLGFHTRRDPLDPTLSRIEIELREKPPGAD